jgi:hypothetical protein
MRKLAQWQVWGRQEEQVFENSMSTPVGMMPPTVIILPNGSLNYSASSHTPFHNSRGLCRVKCSKRWRIHFTLGYVA